jgi:hypothetical protein
MRYIVYTKYDDGFEFTKEFDVLGEAKSYFHHVDVQDIEICTLRERLDAPDENGNEFSEIAHKEPRKKKTDA